MTPKKALWMLFQGLIFLQICFTNSNVFPPFSHNICFLPVCRQYLQWLGTLSCYLAHFLYYCQRHIFPSGYHHHIKNNPEYFLKRLAFKLEKKKKNYLFGTWSQLVPPLRDQVFAPFLPCPRQISTSLYQTIYKYQTKIRTLWPHLIFLHSISNTKIDRGDFLLSTIHTTVYFCTRCVISQTMCSFAHSM